MSDTSAGGITAITGTFLGLGTLAVLIRFISRHRQKMPLLADDWLMLPAVASFIGASALFLRLIDLKALGYSSFDISKEVVLKSFQETQMETVIANILFTFSLGCIKASALFFYKRIFCVSGRKAAFSIILLVTLILLTLWTIFFIFFIGFQCRNHFAALWDGTQAQKCGWAFPVIYGASISDFLFDLWILALPIPLIAKLHTTVRRKLSITSVFLLACIALGASIARMVIFTQITTAGPKVFLMDHERYLTKAGFYMILELGIAIVAVNLPSIWLVFVNLDPAGIARSVRSAISLASVGGRSSKSSRTEEMTAKRPIGSSSSALPWDEAARHPYHEQSHGTNDVEHGGA